MNFGSNLGPSVIKLNRHPFPVEAHFDKSLVLGFAVPKAELEALIPECLELDLFEDRWAFIAVAMVQTRQLRPRYFPKLFGRDFTLIGYRIFVRYRNSSGRRLRGLYILGSETDKASMQRLGRVFTQYRYDITPIGWKSDTGTEIVTTPGGLRVEAETADENSELPESSPFPDWSKARQFAGPMPFTFSYDPARKEVVIVEGVRSSWIPQPMEVNDWKIPFVDQLGLKDVTLANAFIVENVPYTWNRGKVESWTG